MAGTDRPGGCLCGAVRFTARPQNHFHACHCDNCRRQAGGVYMAFEVEAAPALVKDDDLTWYQSSDWAERGFCKRCGATLFWSADAFDKHYVAIGAFDDMPQGSFETELYSDRRPEAFSFEQATHQMTKAEVEAQYAEGAQ